MSFSNFHVWAIILLSADMKNQVVNRFRRRSEAEDCLRLLRRSKPDKGYEIMYAPPENSSMEYTKSELLDTKSKTDLPINN